MKPFRKEKQERAPRANVSEMEPFDLEKSTPDHLEVCIVAINGKEVARAEYDAGRGVFHKPNKRSERIRNVTHWKPEGAAQQRA